MTALNRKIEQLPRMSATHVGRPSEPTESRLHRDDSVRFTYVGGPASWGIFAKMLEDEGLAVAPPIEHRDQNSVTGVMRITLEVVGDATLTASVLRRVKRQSRGQFDIEGLPEDGEHEGP